LYIRVISELSVLRRNYGHRPHDPISFTQSQCTHINVLQELNSREKVNQAVRLLPSYPLGPEPFNKQELGDELDRIRFYNGIHDYWKNNVGIHWRFPERLRSAARLFR